MAKKPASKQKPKPSPRPKPKALPEPTFNKLRLIRSVLAFLILVILGLGAWMYWPPAARSFVPGIGVYAQCPRTPEVGLTAQVIDSQVYRISLDIKGTDLKTCSRLAIVTPPELQQIIQLENITEVNEESLRRGRHPFSDYKFATDMFGQTIVDVYLDKLKAGSLLLEFEQSGLIQQTFERYRLLIPYSANTPLSRALGVRVPIKINSVAIPSSYEVADISPTPTAQKLQFGFEVVYFGSAPLSELNISFVDKDKEWLKSIFAVFAIATCTSLIATFLWEGSKPR